MIPSHRRVLAPPAGVVMAAVAISLFSSALARADDVTCVAASEAEIALRQAGKLHDALKQLAICADATCPEEVRVECERRASEITPAIPTLVFAAKDGAGNDLYAVSVTMDGAPLAHALDGRPLALDPGTHTFTFQTAGAPPIEKTFVLREGEKDRHETIVLGSPPPVLPPPLPPPSPSWWTWQRAAAVSAGGLGVVALGLGFVFGGLALTDSNLQKRDCPPVTCPNFAQGNADDNTATHNATASTVLITSGAVLLAGGAALFFTAKSPAQTSSATGAGDFRIAPMITSKGAFFSIGMDR